MEFKSRTLDFLKIKDEPLFFPEYIDLYREWEDDTIFEQHFDEINSSLSSDTLFEVKKHDENNDIIIDIGISTICYYYSWERYKYKQFLENIEKNIPSKFTFKNNQTHMEYPFGGLDLDDGIYTASWIYMDGYIYFTIHDSGIVRNHCKVKIDEIILERLKNI
jgi:hypothetical protein